MSALFGKQVNVFTKLFTLREYNFMLNVYFIINQSDQGSNTETFQHSKRKWTKICLPWKYYKGWIKIFTDSETKKVCSF